jgi:hypothetical protein
MKPRGRVEFPMSILGRDELVLSSVASNIRLYIADLLSFLSVHAAASSLKWPYCSDSHRTYPYPRMRTTRENPSCFVQETCDLLMVDAFKDS